jgi:hypothetical protein
MSQSHSEVIDADSFRAAMGEIAFQRMMNQVYDELAVRAHTFAFRQARLMAAHERLARAAASSDSKGHVAGMQPGLMMEMEDIAWLNWKYPGWQTDAEFNRDLARYHPETQVQNVRPMNKVGWTSSLNAQAAPRHRGIVVTDRRGNVEGGTA